MPDPFLCVYGHTNLDHIITLERFPERNTSVNVVEKRLHYGGTGANVAIMVASLGVPVALVSYVGPDLPAGFRKLLVDKGVDLTDLVELPGQDTPTVWIVTDGEQNQIAYVYQGAMAEMDQQEPRLTMARRAERVHIMTGRPDYYLRLLPQLRKLGKKIGFDPAQEIHNVWDSERFKQALAQADVFFCNENELRTAERYMGVKRAEELLETIPLMVRTKGARGSELLTREGTISIPAIAPKQVVDPTGAGDAFRAGFYAGLFHKFDLRGAGVIGAANASYVIEERGALSRIPTWEMVLERARPHL